MNLKGFAAAALLCGVSILNAQEAPTGSAVQPNGDEQKALTQLKGSVKGKIIWSTSRANSKHDIWIMNADGTGQKPLTASPSNVDWFPRFSPDGKKVVFTRSKLGWVAESDAEMFDKWDVWTINVDGTGETKVAEDAVWGSWRPSGDSIVYAAGTKAFVKSVNGGDAKEIFDAEVAIKKGAYAQQPQLSPDGKFLAVTIRGTARQTGIWNLLTKTWTTTGGGCEATWFPTNDRILRVNEGQGNGGTEVLAIHVSPEGKPVEPVEGLSISDKIRFIDLPGRRSHEYFPKLNQTGEYMVWGSTQVGHEHDIVDYEIYVWKITADKKAATRITFNSGNDRWPDLFTE